MIQEFTFDGEGWKILHEFEGWRTGLLRYSERFAKLSEMEKHLKSDEAFVLLQGEATLYTENEERKMKPLVLYNIPKGIFHHIVLSKDAVVFVVENSNTVRENTEKWYMKGEN